MRLVLRTIPLFTSIRELRLYAPLMGMVASPFTMKIIKPTILDPRRTSVHSLVMVNTRKPAEKSRFSYRYLVRMMGDVVLLSDIRSLTIVGVIDDGVLGLVHDGLECLRWQICPKALSSDDLGSSCQTPTRCPLHAAVGYNQLIICGKPKQ